MSLLQIGAPLRSSLVSLLLLALVVAAASCSDDSEGMADLDGREVSVGIEMEYLPFHWADPDTGERTGADHDLIVEICGRLGCVPHFVVNDWETMIESVSQGRFDLSATGIAVRPERAEIVDYSEPYLRDDLRIMVRRGEDRFASATGLGEGDFIVGAQVATVLSARADELVGAERVQTFAHTIEAVTALLDGDVDAVVISGLAGVGYIDDHNGAVEFTGEPLVGNSLGIIFPPGSNLVAPFNQALRAMKSDGTLQAIIDRYFSG